MKTQHIVIVTAVVALSAFLCQTISAQGPLQMVTEYSHRQSDYHAGMHSGLWTYDRQQILEEESKDPHRSCKVPYCNRCSKHLADYGHEYQYVGGPSQRQLWYRGTAGSIAHTTQRCYDEHGMPYYRRGRPAGVMSWEYQRYLNHSISDQIRARNAVAAEETSEERVAMLNDLRDIALARYLESEERWEYFKNSDCCVAAEGRCNACGPCSDGAGNAKEAARAAALAVAAFQCDYCKAKAQYLKDKDYLAEVEKERTSAIRDWQAKSEYATKRVRLALLTKEDAEKATRFKRIHHKPPKYKDVLILKEMEEAEKAAKDKAKPTQAPEEDHSEKGADG